MTWPEGGADQDEPEFCFGGCFHDGGEMSEILFRVLEALDDAALDFKDWEL